MTDTLVNEILAALGDAAELAEVSNLPAFAFRLDELASKVRDAVYEARKAESND